MRRLAILAVGAFALTAVDVGLGWSNATLASGGGISAIPAAAAKAAGANHQPEPMHVYLPVDVAQCVRVLGDMRVRAVL